MERWGAIVVVFCPHYWRWPFWGLCGPCAKVYDIVRIIKTDKFWADIMASDEALSEELRKRGMESQ